MLDFVGCAPPQRIDENLAVLLRNLWCQLLKRYTARLVFGWAIFEGRVVGATDGAIDGANEGVSDGSSEGDIVGSFVGESDGTSVGFAVGCSVGTSVGLAVAVFFRSPTFGVFVGGNDGL